MSRRSRMVFFGIVCVAFAVRLYLVVSTAYGWDEDREWIPLGQSISFSPEAPNLPWRSLSHHAATAYIVKATSSIFGDNAIGFRIGFALAGAVMVWAVGMLAWEWLGFPGAVIAATVLALNEYHIGVSAFATEKSPYLMFAALAMLHFGRFLKSEQPRNLQFAAVFAGGAFLFKETAGLLLPICVGALILAGRAAWLKRRETYVAAAFGFAIVLPDIVWNLYNWEQGYGLHSSRVAGVGVNRHFLLFFSRDLVADIYSSMGRVLRDPVSKYPVMNAVWGAIFLGSACFALVMWRKLEPIGRQSALLFWVVLMFFTLSGRGESRLIFDNLLMVDGQAWFWVDLVLIGGAVLVAWAITTLKGRSRSIGIVAVVVASLFSFLRIFRQLGLADVQWLVYPATIWPPDGRLADVRVFTQSCMICDIKPQLVEALTDTHDGSGPVPSSTANVKDLTLGVDDRQFRVVAAVDASGMPKDFFSKRRDYVFKYATPDKSREWSVVTRVMLPRKRPPPPGPFWARQLIP